MDKKCNNPGNRTLQNYNQKGIKSSEFPSDCGNCRNTRCVQQRKYKEHKCRKLVKQHRQLVGISAQQNTKRADNTLFSHKTCDKRRSYSPIIYPERLKYRNNKITQKRQQALRRIRNKIQA